MSADGYEGDDALASAKPYAGVQSHTFHTTDDVDWISFTVPAEDATNAVPYHIRTYNLGWGMEAATRSARRVALALDRA